MAEKFHPECMKPSGKNPVPSTPLDPNVNLAEQMAKGPTDKEKDAEETAKWDVKAIVGTLIYLMITTRFDLMFAVGQAARYVARPSMILVKALKRIIALWGFMCKPTGLGSSQCVDCGFILHWYF